MEKVWVLVNGVRQGMFVTGAERDKPVLLFVHGGPGMPEFWLTERRPTALESLFSVVWWEQRGAGLSYHSGSAGMMTVAQFVDDALAVTNQVRRRFGTNKVYLMGHSWGSLVGLLTAAAAPDRFHAYIGVGQVTNQMRSETEAYDRMLRRSQAVGDRRMVRRLERAGRPGDGVFPRGYARIRDTAMHRAGGGTTRDMRSVVTGIFWPSLRCHAYTPSEKVALWRGKVGSRSSGLFEEMLAADLTQAVPRLEVPAYLLHGWHDLTTSYALAREYAARLVAPKVGFYTFSASAHSPMFEEPGRTLRILREDVLPGTTGLADPR